MPNGPAGSSINTVRQCILNQNTMFFFVICNRLFKKKTVQVMYVFVLWVAKIIVLHNKNAFQANEKSITYELGQIRIETNMNKICISMFVVLMYKMLYML